MIVDIAVCNRPYMLVLSHPILDKNIVIPLILIEKTEITIVLYRSILSIEQRMV